MKTEVFTLCDSMLMLRQRLVLAALIGWFALIVWGRFALFLTVKNNAPWERIPANVHPVAQPRQPLPIPSPSDSDRQPTEESSLPTPPRPSREERLTPVDPAKSVDINELTTNRTVSVLLPPFIDFSAREAYAQSLKTSYNITTNYQYFPSRRAYKSALTYHLNTSWSVDIVMIPSLRIKSFKNRGLPLSFSEVITPYFHTLFTPWITFQTLTFIPYVLDVPITLYNWSLTLLRPSLGDITSTARIRPHTHESLSLLFWTDPGTVQLLYDHEEPFPTYFSILFILLQQAALANSTTPLHFLLLADYRSLPAFQHLVTQKEALHTWCSYLPIPCLLEENAASAWFGFLHMIEQRITIHGTFNGNIWAFPLTSSSYPVIGRWRIINRTSSHPEDAIARIQLYLQHTSEQTIPTPISMFSAYTPLYQQQLLQTSFQWFTPFQFSLFLVEWSLQDEQLLIDETDLIEFLKGNFNSTILLEQLRWLLLQ